MTISKYREVRIIGALKQVEVGRWAEGVACARGVSKHTIQASPVEE